MQVEFPRFVILNDVILSAAAFQAEQRISHAQTGGTFGKLQILTRPNLRRARG
jgi:hypothetical protein